jgi:hypothetical protein
MAGPAAAPIKLTVRSSVPRPDLKSDDWVIFFLSVLPKKAQRRYHIAAGLNYTFRLASAEETQAY